MLDGVWFSQIANPLKDSLEKAFCVKGISVLYCCVGMEENRAPFPDGLNFHFTRMLGVVSIMVLLNLPRNCLQTEDLEKNLMEYLEKKPKVECQQKNLLVEFL
ncbi:hypothetical protein BVRB_3g053440 [Beta vulgaris subsp. vulgaris]|nr:hypothetical protein BVRB_3g053440 [Beta vulgaris subsp. vulgaris]